MDKGDVHRREPRHDIGLDERRVEPLIGDAVAVEDNPVAILDRERALGPQAGANPENKAKAKDRSQASLIVRVITRRLPGKKLILMSDGRSRVLT